MPLIAAPSAPEPRVAIVVGNAAYPGAPLANPVRDAEGMSAVLRAMDFQVIEVHDGSREQMLAAVDRATQLLHGQHGVGLFYYAGHGLQLDWHNYLVPVDSRLSTASQVPAQTVDVQIVLDAFRAAGTRTNIVVLDACRDNPFAAEASGKGLAPMDAPPSTLLAYATAPGNVAEDGVSSEDGNGLYTQHLVSELKSRDLAVEDVFKRVRLQVRRESEGRQVPWESTSLEEAFYFDPSHRSIGSGTPEEQFASEKAEWDRIRTSGNPDDFYAFLERHPSGSLGEQAQFRLDQLQQTRVQEQPGADGIRHLPSGVNRFALGDVIRERRVDGRTGATTDIVQRVTLATQERVEFNGGTVVFDQMGGTLRNRFGDKDPAILEAPADLAIGKHWRTGFTNTPKGQQAHTNFWESRVVALENIEIPAGTIKAYRIESRGESRAPSGGVTYMNRTTWIDPTTMITVRNDIVFRSGDKVTQFDSTRLVAFERAAR